MITVAVIVYNRTENLETWLNAWQFCDQTDAELIVIHNCDDDKLYHKYLAACKVAGVKYHKRENKGYDIAAFRDMCSGKFGKFEELLWCTDDTIPMSKDFVKHFRLSQGVGARCMEATSKMAPLHIRTTGFCISWETAQKLRFPERIETKEDCYFFEHRGKSETLMNQILAMGLKVEMTEPVLWDTDKRKQLNRWEEHKRVFRKESKVIFIALAYNNYPQIISSLLCQTYKNWELYIIHDGPGNIEGSGGDRVNIIYTNKRVGNYGHSLRAKFLQKLKDAGDYIVITNVDNYYMPDFTRRAVEVLDNNPNAVGAYSQQIIHNYTGWKVMNCSLNRGYLDCGGVMLRAKEAAEVGWHSVEHSADWFFFADIIRKHGSKSFVPFPGVNFVHN